MGNRFHTQIVYGGVAALAVLGVSPAHASPNLIVNGSFEDSAFNTSGDFALGLVGNDVPGWFIPHSDGTYPWGLQNGAFGVFTPYGNQFFVLGETGASGGVPFDYTIQQTMTGLTPGKTYMLSFAIASEENCCAMTEVSFLSGSSTGAMDFTAPASFSSTTFWTSWGTDSMNFVATSSSVTLQFKDLAIEETPTPESGADLGLDNVVVTGSSTVPEPSTWAMMLLGFAGLGFAGRRASRKRSVFGA